VNDERLGVPSASSAYLRYRCAGAWNLITSLKEQGTITEQESFPAKAGTEIHAAIAGREIDLSSSQQEMVERLKAMEQEVVNHWAIGEAFVAVSREKRVYLRTGLDPICSGQYDWKYAQKSRCLIGDHKSGRVEVASADINDQLRDLAALVHFDCPEIREISVSLCQPLISGRPSVAVYDEYEAELALRLLRTNLAQVADPDAVRTPGVHCAHCPAAPYCEENRLMVNSVLTLAERIKKGDYQLPVGKYGTTFLDRALMAQKVLELIIEKYKELLRSDSGAVPGYYLKAGNTRQVLTNPDLAFEALALSALSIPEFLACGKFSLTQLLKAYTKHSGLPQAEAEPAFWSLLKGAVITVTNEPSLAKESPRRGRPKEFARGDFLPP
jgi:hypothetical protein